MVGSQSKKHIKLFLKVSTSLSLISWLLYNADIQAVVNRWADVRWILLICIITILHLCMIIVKSVRLNTLLEKFGLKASVLWLSLIQLRANFLRNFLPGGVSAEIYKGIALTKNTNSVSESISVIFAEKVFGAFSMLCVCLTGFFYGSYFTQYEIYQKLHKPVIALLLTVAFAIVVIFIFRYIDLSRFKFSSGSMLRGFFRIISQFQSLLTANKQFIRVVFLSICIQLIIVAWHLSISYELGIRLTYFQLMMTIPLAELLLMLPISIGGIGVREASFVMLLNPLGISFDEAISFSLLSLFVVTITRSIAGFAFLFSFDKIGDSVNTKE